MIRIKSLRFKCSVCFQIQKQRPTGILQFLDAFSSQKSSSTTFCLWTGRRSAQESSSSTATIRDPRSSRNSYQEALCLKCLSEEENKTKRRMSNFQSRNVFPTLLSTQREKLKKFTFDSSSSSSCFSHCVSLTPHFISLVLLSSPPPSTSFSRVGQSFFSLSSRACWFCSPTLKPSPQLGIPSDIHLVADEESAQTSYKWILEQTEVASSQRGNDWWTGKRITGTVIGVDSEGMHLGRFGKLCVLQLVAGNRIFICDALKPGVVSAFEPLLTSPVITKVCHDCREDNSALYYQHGFSLRNVFDTQVAHCQVLAAQKQTLFQVGMADLLKQYLSVTSKSLTESVKEMMGADMCLWQKRPLRRELLQYAVFGVMYLPALMQSLTGKLLLLGCDPRDVVRGSRKFVRYYQLNAKFKSAAEIATRGAFIQGMMAARTDHSLILKLNCGRQATVCTPSAMSRFEDVQLGDIADLRVATVSIDGTFVYVDREDSMYDYWNLRRRCRNRHQTARTAMLPDQVVRKTPLAGHPINGENIDPHLLPSLNCDHYDGVDDEYGDV